MKARHALAVFLIPGFALCITAQETSDTRPVELFALEAYIGVWDAEIEVWPHGPDSPSITFQGVETNRAFGEHWIASDFESEYMGQTVSVHAIVGYDLDRRKLVGTVIDHGPYSASMTGDFDAKLKTVTWMTHAKDPTGKPMVQRTLVTQRNADERELVLMVPTGEGDEYIRFMQILFVKRE